MFGAPVAKKKGGQEQDSGLQNALFAKRLDQAIETVEDILKE